MGCALLCERCGTECESASSSECERTEEVSEARQCEGGRGCGCERATVKFTKAAVDGWKDAI